MGLLDKLQKWSRFYSEAKILARIPAKTTYTEKTINGEIVKQTVLIDGENVKTSLYAKAAYIHAASQKERKAREKAAPKLSALEIMKLRKKEDKARYLAYKHIHSLEGR